MAKTEVEAAKLLLNRGIRFTMPDAPIWDRIRRKNRLHIRPLRAGTIMEIAILVLEGELDKPLTNWQLYTKLDVIAKIIATAVLNNDKKIEKEQDLLATKLLNRFLADALISIYRHIESLNRIEDFMIITRYFNRQTKMLMMKKTGHQVKGS